MNDARSIATVAVLMRVTSTFLPTVTIDLVSEKASGVPHGAHQKLAGSPEVRAMRSS